MHLSQPVRSHHLPIRTDLGHVLAQAELVSGHPQLCAGTALLVAAAAANRSARSVPVSIQVGHPGAVVHALNMATTHTPSHTITVGSSPERLAERVVQWNPEGKVMRGRIRLRVALAATTARAAGVNESGGGGADGPFTRD